MNKSEKDEEIHMSTPPSKRDDVWWDGKNYIPFSEMTPVHLQRAKMLAQKKELSYFKTTSFFAQLSEKLDEEAQRRGITLKDWDADYFKNQQILKEAAKKAKGD